LALFPAEISFGQRAMVTPIRRRKRQPVKIWFIASAQLQTVHGVDVAAISQQVKVRLSDPVQLLTFLILTKY